jgi:hypothetical protein
MANAYKYFMMLIQLNDAQGEEKHLKKQEADDSHCNKNV